MRQLDLFGSVFETPPAENKPGEKTPAVKKEEQIKEVYEAVEVSLTSQAIRTELRGANRLNKKSESIAKEEQKAEEKPEASPFSLLTGTETETFEFGINSEEVGKVILKSEAVTVAETKAKSADYVINGEETGTVAGEKEPAFVSTIREVEETLLDVSIPLIEAAADGKNEAINPVKQILENSDEPVGVSNKKIPEALKSEDEKKPEFAPTVEEVAIAKIAPIKKDEHLIADTLAAVIERKKVEKKPAAPKVKKVQAPELERTGAVIFDDGKITVKIKSKSPFPAPAIKEKKEKVKKPLQKRGRKSFKEIDAEVDLIQIPEDEILFKKQYYPISEVAKWFRVNTSLLRFWENEFDVLKPRKNRKGDRLFRPEDIKNLELIYQLLRQRKYTIEGAKEYIKTNKKKADIQQQLTSTLQKFKSFLLDLKANLQTTVEK